HVVNVGANFGSEELRVERRLGSARIAGEPTPIGESKWFGGSGLRNGLRVRVCRHREIDARDLVGANLNARRRVSKAAFLRRNIIDAGLDIGKCKNAVDSGEGGTFGSLIDLPQDDL